MTDGKQIGKQARHRNWEDALASRTLFRWLREVVSDDDVRKPFGSAEPLIIERSFGGTDRRGGLAQGTRTTLDAIKRSAESTEPLREVQVHTIATALRGRNRANRRLLETLERWR
jgi:hypothetical protein